MSQKTYNWNTLNLKVLKKLGLNLSKKEIEAIVNMEPDAIEKVILALKYHIETYSANKRSQRIIDAANPARQAFGGHAPQSVSQGGS